MKQRVIEDEKNQYKYMKQAIKEAKKALLIGEVPIGAVVVKDGKIIARAYNKKEKMKDATCHAEVLAIKKASKKLNDWRLTDCDMYVTLEPCVMCSGLIVSARIRNVYYATADFSGNFSGNDVLQNKFMNHKSNLIKSVMEEESKGLIRQFFQDKRK